METVLTFDIAYCARLRDQLTKDRMVEGKDYRIGMGEKRYEMTLRGRPGDAILLRLSAEKVGIKHEDPEWLGEATDWQERTGGGRWG